MKYSVLLMIVISALILSFQVSASEIPLKTEIITLSQQYWDLNNSYWEKQISEESFIKKHGELLDRFDSLAQEIITEHQNGLPEKMQLFGELYRSDDIQKHPEIQMVVDSLIVSEIKQYLKKNDVTSDEEYPGFGFADPSYCYQRREETKQEVLEVFWKKIEKEHVKNERYKTYMEVGVSLGAGFDVKKIAGPFNMKINGVYKKVVEVEVTVKETVKTSETVKYQNMKVWYNLYRCKKSFWGNPSGKWELCGQTYLFREEPSGLPFTQPKSNSSETPAGQKFATVTVDCAFVRRGPGKEFADLASMKKGIKVPVSEEQNGWFKITTPGGTIGWISGKCVEISE